MSKYGYLEVFMMVPSMSRYRESTVDCLLRRFYHWSDYGDFKLHIFLMHELYSKDTIFRKCQQVFFFFTNKIKESIEYDLIRSLLKFITHPYHFAARVSEQYQS